MAQLHEPLSASGTAAPVPRDSAGYLADGVAEHPRERLALPPGVFGTERDAVDAMGMSRSEASTTTLWVLQARCSAGKPL